MTEGNIEIKGEPSGGEDFFNLLLQTKDFCNELGKVTLLSGKLEAELILYLERNEVQGKLKMATLGTLIRIAKENDLLNANLHIALKAALTSRNYLMHNIYSLFTERIDETILPSSNILDSDVYTYEDKAWELRQALVGLIDAVQSL
ncbi:hypothetical protein [Roseivirga pacifica]|jgi:hypothetical protein|uniref:hypothetical protein n=1 Tax=Roseivirga pacifica TaxID=1267423 RepID=UPI003BAD7C1E